MEQLINYVVFNTAPKVVEKTRGWYKRFFCELSPDKYKENRWHGKCHVCGARHECKTKTRLKQQIDLHRNTCR